MSKELNLTALSIARGLCMDAFAGVVGDQKARGLEHLRAAMELQDLLFARLAANGAPEQSEALQQWLDLIAARLDALPALDSARCERGFRAARKAGIPFEAVLNPTELPHDVREAFEVATGR